jgi:hypothetical protein
MILNYRAGRMLKQTFVDFFKVANGYDMIWYDVVKQRRLLS